MRVHCRRLAACRRWIAALALAAGVTAIAIVVEAPPSATATFLPRASAGASLSAKATARLHLHLRRRRRGRRQRARRARRRSLVFLVLADGIAALAARLAAQRARRSRWRRRSPPLGDRQRCRHVALGEVAVPPGDARLEAAHDLRQPRGVASTRRLATVAAHPVVRFTQLRRRLDLVAHVVVDLLEDDQRGLARRQAEALADLADPDLVRARLAFERCKRQACPLHGGEARRVRGRRAPARRASSARRWRRARAP